jgi:glycosyltransferase involved in cell wall biosynthesis
MPNRGLVSVIIPCYRQAHFLGQAIESVRAQTYPHVEVIVVDDGSPDNTAEVAARYAQVRYIAQKNAGPSAARNTGLQISRGEFIVFLDADDRLLPDALAIGLKHLRDHPECAFVSGQRRIIAYDGTPLALQPLPCVKRNHYLSLLTGNYIGCTATVLHRREVLVELAGFDCSLRCSEDYELYLRVAREHPIHCHSELVAEYRQHDENSSHNYAGMMEGAVAALQLQWDYVKGNRRYEAAYHAGIRHVRNHYRSAQLVEDIHRRVRAKDWRRALQGMIELLRCNPREFAGNAGRKLYVSLTGR